MARMTVYACPGMKFYVDALKRHLMFMPYDPKSAALFLGIYFRDDLDQLIAHEGPRYVFWNGSDVVRTVRSEGWHPMLRKVEAVHATHTQALADELATIGITATVSPTLFDRPSHYGRSWVMPGGHPKVYMTTHGGRDEEYGVPQAIDLVRYTNASLYIYGNEGMSGRYGNVHFRGTVSEEVWKSETDSMHAALRLNAHDGMSQIVMKALLRGHYSIQTTNLWSAFKSLRDLETEEYANPDKCPPLNLWLNSIMKENKHGVY